MKIFTEHMLEIIWNKLTRHDMAVLIKNNQKIPYKYLDSLETHLSEMVNNNEIPGTAMYQIFKYQQLNVAILNKYIMTRNLTEKEFNAISKYQPISAEFIKKHKYKLNTHLMLKNKNLLLPDKYEYVAQLLTKN